MRKLATFMAVAGPATAIALVLTGAPKVAQAVDVSCDATIVFDTVLTHNLDCTGGAVDDAGLEIGADGITLDLNGFVIEGLPGTSGTHGVRNPGFDGVTVQNGVIDGFEQGVRAVAVSDFEVRHLTFTGQTSSHAVDVLDSVDVKVMNSSFVMPVTDFLSPEAIRLESVDDAKVEHNHILGGFIGVNFACGDCDGNEADTNGGIKGNVIHGAFIGILIANSTKTEVLENHVSGGVTVTIPAGPTLDSKGISAGFDPAVPVSGLVIAKNRVHDIDGFGLRFMGVTGSEVKDNEFHVNTLDGVALLRDNGTGSTGNKITNNTSTGNAGEDMRHDDLSAPNLWEDNKCVESEDGAANDIDCGT